MTTSSPVQALPPVGAVASKIASAAMVSAEPRAGATLSKMAGRIS